MTRGDFERGVVPVGRYAQGGRSPIVWTYLCAACAGYAPLTDQDYSGNLTRTCNGCGVNTREVHRFRAWIDTADGCQCSSEHPQAIGDVRAAVTMASGEAP